MQIDIKYVPTACLVGEAQGQKFYQFTFLDEYSRFRYLEAFDEFSTYTTTQFLKHVVKRFPYAIECVQTDNGSEFTNRLNSQATKKENPLRNYSGRAWHPAQADSALHPKAQR